MPIPLGLRRILGSLLVVALVASVLVGTITGLQTYSQRVWRENSRANLVLLAPSSGTQSGVFLATLLVTEKELRIISFPAGLRVETIGGFGPYRIEALFPLGELTGKGGELLSRTLAEYLGVQIDGWVALPDDFRLTEAGIGNDWRRMLVLGIRGRSITNLTLYDFVRLWYETLGIRQGDISWKDLFGTRGLMEDRDPDGEVFYLANSELLDQTLARQFFIPEMVSEEIPIAVVNATDVRGLGSRVGRTIRNIGGDVISVTDASRKREKSSLVFSDAELLDSATRSILVRRFAIAEVGVGDTSDLRAAALLIVGEDYRRLLEEL